MCQSPQNKQNWVTCGDMDGPRDCHRQWSKSEREKQIYINTHMWNLEKWHRWSYLQNRHRCRGQMYGHQGRKGSEMNWETGIDTYILLIFLTPIYSLLLVFHFQVYVKIQWKKNLRQMTNKRSKVKRKILVDCMTIILRRYCCYFENPKSTFPD